MIRIEVESKKSEKFGQVIIKDYESKGRLGDLVQELSDLIVAVQENILTEILTPVENEKSKKEIKEAYLEMIINRMRG